MIEPDNEILLDTNVLVHLLRRDEIGRQVEVGYEVWSRSIKPLVSMITVGEIKALARRNGYGEIKQRTLDAMIEELVVVEVGSVISDHYAAIQAAQQRIGRPIGENDTWIAATAATSGAVLLTTDRDFGKLVPGLIKVEIIAKAKS